MTMSDKTLRAINKGRRKAGLKPIRRKGTTKGEVRKTARRAYEPKKKDLVTGKRMDYEKIGNWKKEGKNYVRYSHQRVSH